MGKCMRKAKVMEASQQSAVGVRTRAKTLALHRLQSQSSSALTAPPPQSNPDSCYYLELRSRRLVKPPLSPKNSRKLRRTSRTCEFEEEDLGIEPCFGENYSDCEARERSGESSLIGETDYASGSTTGKGCSSERTWPVTTNIPTAPELEKLFAYEEKSQQHFFIEKYNFDIVNDLPLPGRYEWVTVRP